MLCVWRFTISRRTEAHRARSARWNRPEATTRQPLQRRIVKVRNGSKNKARIAIESLPDADQLELTDSLRLHSPTIVHFSGHGEVDGSLVMRDEEGATYEMHPEGVAKLIALDKDTIRLVVLNACYSSELAELLVNDIDGIIGMKDAASDDAAILFARAFYGALFDGATVARAFATSAANLAMKYHDEANTPEMRCKPGVDPERMHLL